MKGLNRERKDVAKLAHAELIDKIQGLKELLVDQDQEADLLDMVDVDAKLIDEVKNFKGL